MVEHYIETFFRNRWLIILPALLLLASGVGVGLLLPPQYEATATIWTEAATYLDVPTAQNQYLAPAEIEARRWSELARTHSYATAVAGQVLGETAVTDRERQAFVKRVQDDLQVSGTGDNTVEIRFEHTDQAVALAVVEHAIAEYTGIVNDASAQQAEEAIKFYREQVRMYEDEILPRSAEAITEYLREHPEAREIGPDGVPLDPPYALLEQQARADRATYQRYQERLIEVETQSAAVSTSQPVAFRIIDAPRIPANASTLNLKLTALVAVVGAGLSAGYAVVFVGLAAKLDPSLRSARDVERTLHLPVLDVVPDYTRTAVHHARQEERISASVVRQSLSGKGNI
jgi:uncharacterized protein involved in exopolysaccharide biosynthesis